MQPGATMDLALRQPAHEEQPPHLRPLLHPDHLGPPELALRSTSSGNPGHRTLKWPDFHPAQAAQPSPGADISGLSRSAVAVGAVRGTVDRPPQQQATAARRSTVRAGSKPAQPYAPVDARIERVFRAGFFAPRKAQEPLQTSRSRLFAAALPSGDGG
jgi:hypothetical protein